MPVSHTLLMYLDVILVFLQVNTLRGVQKVKFLLTRESDHCSCPLISRQGVYLKLTLIFSRRAITQRTVRMVFIVMFDRHCKIMQCRSYIRFRHERDVVFLHRFHEPFCNSITLRTADCRCAGLQIQLSGELPCFMRSIR